MPRLDASRTTRMLPSVLGSLVAVAAITATCLGDEPAGNRRPQPAASRSGTTPKKLPLGLQVIRPADSSRKTRAVAIAELPVDRLSDDVREHVEELVKTAAVFRRLPTIRFEILPATYEYFRTNPEIAVAIWRVMEISELKLERTEPDRLEARSPDGSTGRLGILVSEPGRTLAVAEGRYTGPLLLAPIRGVGLLHIRGRFERDRSGRMFVTHTADLFVRFPSTSMQTVARIISPFTNLIADRNFQDISLFMRLMSLTMSTRPGWIEQLVERLEDIPVGRRLALLKVAAREHVAELKRRDRAPEVSRP